MVESIITDVCGLRHYLGTDSSPQRGARVHRRSPSVRPPLPSTDLPAPRLCGLARSGHFTKTGPCDGQALRPAAVPRPGVSVRIRLPLVGTRAVSACGCPGLPSPRALPHARSRLSLFPQPPRWACGRISFGLLFCDGWSCRASFPVLIGHVNIFLGKTAIQILCPFVKLRYWSFLLVVGIF